MTLKTRHKMDCGVCAINFLCVYFPSVNLMVSNSCTVDISIVYPSFSEFDSCPLINI